MAMVILVPVFRYVWVDLSAIFQFLLLIFVFSAKPSPFPHQEKHPHPQNYEYSSSSYSNHQSQRSNNDHNIFGLKNPSSFQNQSQRYHNPSQFGPQTSKTSPNQQNLKQQRHEEQQGLPSKSPETPGDLLQHSAYGN